MLSLLLLCKLCSVAYVIFSKIMFLCLEELHTVVTKGNLVDAKDTDSRDKLNWISWNESRRAVDQRMNEQRADEQG